MATTSSPWGSIREVVTGPPDDVPADASYASVFLMWLFLPFNIMAALIALCSQSVYVSYALTVKQAVDSGRPFCYAFAWWRYLLFGLLLLLQKAKGSRFFTFRWQREAFGGDHFWQSEGIWSCAYARVDSILRSNQKRDAAFAAITAPTPELWNRRIILFQSNAPGEGEWSAFRVMLAHHFLGAGDSASQYAERVAALHGKVKGAWGAEPQLSDLKEGALVSRLVAACVFFVFTGAWVTKAESETLAKWFSQAGYWVLPRLLQRFTLGICASASRPRPIERRGQPASALPRCPAQ